MEHNSDLHILFAVVSEKNQTILSRHETGDEAIVEAFRKAWELRDQGKSEEEVSDIRVLRALDLTEQEKEEILKSPMQAGLLAIASWPTRRPIYYFEPDDVYNPLKLDPRGIPYGPYCYSWEEDPNPPPKTPKNEMFHGYRIKHCPYLQHRIFNGVRVPWCNFLDAGGERIYARPGQSDEEFNAEHNKLVEHFGNEEELEKVLSLGSLWDCIKACGIGK